MARRLRLQYEGALYHVINRGNYRRAVFETAGAARAFEAVLGEACDRFGQFSRGWVIGTHGWRKAVALEQTHLAVTAGIASDELRDIKEPFWRRTLDAALQEWTKTQADVERDPKKARWKIEIATRLRWQAAAAVSLDRGRLEDGKPRVASGVRLSSALTFFGLTPSGGPGLTPLGPRSARSAR